MPPTEPVEVIAQFSEAELVKTLHGKLDLRGGPEADRQQASR